MDAMPALLAGWLLLAIVCDTGWRRLPNWLTLTGAIAAVLAALVSAHPFGHNWPTALLWGELGLAATLPMFFLGQMGGGDVKFMAALGGWFGPALLPIWALGAIALGLHALVLLLVGKPRSGRPLPYGLHVGGAALIVLADSLVRGLS